MENRVKFIAAVVIIAILLVVGNSSTSAKTHDYDRIGIAVICAALIVAAIGSIIRDRVAA